MILKYPQYRLEYCTFPKDTPGLPSWVPDWQRIGRLGLFPLPLSYHDVFHASKDREQPLVAESSGFVLRQKGALVDSIAAVFDFSKVEDFEQVDSAGSMVPWSKARRTRYMKSILVFAEPHFKDDTSERTLWQVMVGGFMRTEKCNVEFASLACRAFRQEPVAAGSINATQMDYILRNSYPFPRKFRQGDDLQLLVVDFCEGIVSNAVTLALGRTLFVTVHGMLGLGPHGTRKGDAVTILFGTQVPLILRSTGDAYSYVGDAYVDGLMEGEGLEAGLDEVNFNII